MQNYLSEYAKMLMDKHGKAPLAKLTDEKLQALVASELAAFAPEPQELVSVAVELRVLVGDDAPPVMPRRKRSRDIMWA